MTQANYQAARDHAALVDRGARRADETGQLATMLQAAATAMLGSQATAPHLLDGLEELSPGAREVLLWRAIAVLAAGDAKQAEALAVALHAPSPVTGGSEFEWRAAALAAMAAERAGNSGAAFRNAERALAAFTQLSSEWGPAALIYEKRRDLSRMLSSARATIARSTPAPSS